MAGQLFSVNSLGGFLDNNMFSEKIRVAAQPLMRFRMHVDAEAEKGESTGAGNTVLFDKIRNIDTAGSSLSETATIPKTQFQIRQGSLVMQEFGNSIPFTEKLTVTSRMNVPELTQIALRNDMAKTLDNQAFLSFSGSDYIGVVVNTATSTITSSGTTPADAAGANMSDKNVRDFIDDMKKKNVPTRNNGLYACISSTNGIRGLYDFFETKANLTTLSVARNGVVGEYYGCLFQEETRNLSNTLNSSYGAAVIFGGDAVREKIATPEQIRIGLPQDFGRDRRIAWYYFGGFTLTWTFASDNENHVMYIGSNA